MAVFPPGGDAAKNPEYVCCAENGLGLRELLKEEDFDVIVTSDKEGPDCGVSTELAISSVNSHHGVLQSDAALICSSQQASHLCLRG